MTLAKKLGVFLFIVAFMVSSVALAALKLPEEIEAEFTQYPGSKVTNSTAAGSMFMASLDCGTDSVDEVFDYYKARIMENDWTIEFESKSENNYSIKVNKESLEGSVIVFSDGEATVVNLAIAVEE